MNPIEAAARKIPKDLNSLGARWALVGGLAVSARAGGRATTDLDVAIAIEADHEVDAIVFGLRALGYGLPIVLNDSDTGLVAMVRVPVSNRSGRELLLDLLVSTTRIENEIVAGAELLDPFPRMRIPVASRGHLIAMKVLSERDDRLKDRMDLQVLLESAKGADVDLARLSVALMVERGSNRKKDLPAILEDYVGRFWKTDGSV